MNDLRLARGRALLAETDMKVTQVAVASGFASASHFSKSFRAKYGVSPYRFSHFGAAEGDWLTTDGVLILPLACVETADEFGRQMNAGELQPR